MRFEGEDVDGLKGTIRLHRFDMEVPLLVGEVVELRVVAYVSEVVHRVDQRTGQVFRDHTVRLKEVEIEQQREDG